MSNVLSTDLILAVHAAAQAAARRAVNRIDPFFGGMPAAEIAGYHRESPEASMFCTFYITIIAMALRVDFIPTDSLGYIVPAATWQIHPMIYANRPTVWNVRRPIGVSGHVYHRNADNEPAEYPNAAKALRCAARLNEQAKLTNV